MTNNSLPDENFWDLAPFIHQAALSAHLDLENLHNICDASIHYGFGGLCTNLSLLRAARERLGNKTATKLIAVIAFPFGAIPTTLKQAEAEWAITNGADELEIVPNFFAINTDKTNLFAEELSSLCSLGIPVRAILDISNLNTTKLDVAVEACLDAGVHGVQSGNGFGRPVSLTDIKQLTKLVRNRCAIKAVGGIKNVRNAIDLLSTGATSIGTTLGPELIKEISKYQK